MKQGDLQALFLQGRLSLTAEDQESDQEIESLLDSWITHIRVLAELLTVWPTSPVMTLFFITQKHLFGQLDGVLSHELPTPTFATEDAIFIHGLHDQIPYAVLSPQGMLVNGYWEANISTKIPIHAGHHILIKWANETLGSANGSGEFDTLVELKQVISPKRWK